MNPKTMSLKVFDEKMTVGLTGLASMLVLERISVIISIGVGLVTFGYMVTKWYFLYKENKEKQ